MAKRITQEAFDEAVRENIDEFEMEREEAIADAVKQFESQGVDLGNVNTTGEENAALTALAAITSYITAHKEDSTIDTLPLIAPLRSLRGELSSADAAQRLLITTNMGVQTLFRTIAFADRDTERPTSWSATQTGDKLAQQHRRAAQLVSDEEVAPGEGALELVLALALTCLELMVRTTSKARDMVGQAGAATLCVVVSNHSDDAELMALVFTALRACLTRAEHNKLAFKNAGGNELTMRVLKTHRHHRACFSAALELLCAATTHDDRRDDQSSAGDSAKQWLQLGAFGMLLGALRKAESLAAAVLTSKAVNGTATDADAGADADAEADATVVTASDGLDAKPATVDAETPPMPPAQSAAAATTTAMASSVTADFFTPALQALLCRCLHRLLTSPEATEMFMKAKGLDVVLAALSRHAADVDVVRHCCETLRLLAGDDELKKTVLGHLSTLVQLAERHQQRTAVLGPIFGTYAILALRSPEIQTQMCTLAGPCVHMQLIRALNMELEKGAARASKAEAAASIGFLCKAVHALRNVVSRSEEARAAALEEGAEATLRQVYVFPPCQDDVFAALRDLGCELDSLGRKYYAHGTKAQTYKKEANFRETANESENFASAYANRARETGCL